MITKTCLDNGVRVISHALPHMHTVTLGIWVANGARSELPEQKGISHFIEHLLFKGTERRTARQISLEMDAMGGVLNAFTGHEYVCYYGKTLSHCLPKAMDLLSDLFLNSTFPEDELERERNVILQEIKMRDDTPEEAIHDRFHQNFWQGHPLGSPIIGTADTVNRLQRSDVIAYRQTWYQPTEIIITAAGNVDHQALVELATDLFSHLHAQGTASQATAGAWQHQGITCSPWERDLEQTLICLGTQGISHTHADRYTLLLLNGILGGGMSSRLFQEVREKKGLAYSVYSYAMSHSDDGALVIYAGTERDHCREVIDISLEEFDRMKREPVTAGELESAREQIKGKLLMSLESTESLMSRLARNEIFFGCHQPIEELLGCFDKVTAEDIMGLAHRMGSSARMNLEVMGKVEGLGIGTDILKR